MMIAKTFFKYLLIIFGTAIMFTGMAWAKTSTTAFEDYEAGHYTQAAKKWQIEAKAGDAFAYFGLGVLYLNGQGVAKNIYIAEKYLLKAAKADGKLGQFQAITTLFDEYGNDQNIPYNAKQAIYWGEFLQNRYWLSEEQEQQLAVLYIDRGQTQDITHAIEVLKNSETGVDNYFIQYWLARAYYILGQKEVARDWFERFLTNPEKPEDALAFDLFEYQLYNESEMKLRQQARANKQKQSNDQLANKWAHHPEAMSVEELNELAQTQYQNPQNDAQVIQILQSASQKGSGEASYHLAQIYNQMALCTQKQCPTLFPSNMDGYPLFLNDTASSAETNTYESSKDSAGYFKPFPSILNPSVLTSDNSGTYVTLNPKSPHFASMVEYLIRASTQGSAPAKFNYAQFLFEGFGVPKDERKALVLLEESAQSGDYDAIAEISERYLKGDGVEKNIPLGLQWLEGNAANQISPIAPLRSAYYYCKGEGIPKNLGQCKKYLNEFYNSGYDADSAIHFIKEDGLGAFLYLIDKKR